MTGERRYEVGFALGNVLPASVLSVGLFALPVRWWPADVVVSGAVLALLATSAVVMSRPAHARSALRIGAQVLLGVGLLVVAAAVLSLAFLAGIHGDFGRGGVTLMILIALLVLPYAIVYPAIQLLWLGPRPRKQRAAAKAAKAAADPPAADPSAETTEAGKAGDRTEAPA
jgi:hypothetical protein